MFHKTDNFTCTLIFLSALLTTCLLSACSSNIPPASSAASGAVTLTWDDATSATAYNVYGATSPGVTKLNGYKIRNAPNPITLQKLKPGKTYYFVVTMVDENGEGEESKELSYTAVAGETGMLDFQNYLKAPIVDTSLDKPIVETSLDEPNLKDVTLTWKAVPGADSYNLYYSTSPGVTKHDGRKISRVNMPYTIQGLIEGTTYYFVVTAVSDAGESEESEEISFTVE